VPRTAMAEREEDDDDDEGYDDDAVAAANLLRRPRPAASYSSHDDRQRQRRRPSDVEEPSASSAASSSASASGYDASPSSSLTSPTMHSSDNVQPQQQQTLSLLSTNTLRTPPQYYQRSRRRPSKLWMDRLEAPLNPCSLEAVPEPLHVFAAEGEEGGGGVAAAAKRVWPVMLSCYQLEDTTPLSSSNANAAGAGAGGQQQRPLQRRYGQMNLYAVEVPDVASTRQPQLPLSFGAEPKAVVLSPTSGVLDGKWHKVLPATRRRRNGRSGTTNPSWAFASAHSSGSIQIHSLEVPSMLGGDDGGGDGNGGGGGGGGGGVAAAAAATDRPMFAVKHLGGTAYNSAGGKNPDDRAPPLCLSLNWGKSGKWCGNGANSYDYPPSLWADNDDDFGVGYSGGNIRSASSIVSTYSNGRIALHDVLLSCGDNDDGAIRSAQFVERDSWQAHDLFSCPSEVWSAGIMSSGCNGATRWGGGTIVSGGDEGCLKFWDVRATSRPVQVVQHDAGVTCIAPHPYFDHLVAVGCYDERMSVYDVRYLSEQRPLCQSKEFGGGVWRLQWHPYNPYRILVAAMHGGCRVVNLKGFSRYCRDRPPPLPDPPPYGAEDDTNIDQDYILASLSFASTFSSSAGTNSTADHLLGDPGQYPMRAKVTKKFADGHESMVYGATWLVCTHPTHRNAYFEAAASCSFYDRTVLLWDSLY